MGLINGPIKHIWVGLTRVDPLRSVVNAKWANARTSERSLLLGPTWIGPVSGMTGPYRTRSETGKKGDWCRLIGTGPIEGFCRGSMLQFQISLIKLGESLLNVLAWCSIQVNLSSIFISSTHIKLVIFNSTHSNIFKADNITST